MDYLAQELENLKTRLMEVEGLLKTEADEELRRMAEEERVELASKIEELSTVGAGLVLARKTGSDGRPQGVPLQFRREIGSAKGASQSVNNCYLEIRAGTGGDEASLFADDLKNMYSRFASLQGWGVTDVSSGRNLILKIKGPGCYERLKSESGTHRVQRVPTTEKNGRVHTSTATVAVMPQVAPVALDLNPGDIKVDFFRGSGHGGQNVNKVETGVKLTHLPTGVIVECVEERYQQRNRDLAESMLRSKLYSLMEEQQAASVNELRASQVGRGERNEKIKTYNFPQDRLTDHRVSVSYHNLPKIMAGEIPGLSS